MSITFTSRAPKRITTLAAALATGALALTACGGESTPLSAPADAATPTSVASQPPEEPTTTTPPTQAPAATPSADAAVKISQTAIGDVLSDPDGMTLYAFTNDVEAKSTCYGTCADAWPPVIVEPDFIVSPGLDSGIFATTVRDDGRHQLVAGKFPLYRFAADAKPGDITGHGSGDVWFAVDLEGRIIDADAPAQESTDAGADAEPAMTSATVQLGETALGPVLTDADGMTLYLFTPDEAGAPTCTDACADAWPPLLLSEGTDLVAGPGLDAELSTVEHPNGGMQVKIGKWPLYRFSGDAAPGDTNGQGSGGKWFVVGADGKGVK